MVALPTKPALPIRKMDLDPTSRHAAEQQRSTGPGLAASQSLPGRLAGPEAPAAGSGEASACDTTTGRQEGQRSGTYPLIILIHALLWSVWGNEEFHSIFVDCRQNKSLLVWPVWVVEDTRSGRPSVRAKKMGDTSRVHGRKVPGAVLQVDETHQVKHPVPWTMFR